VPALNDNVRIAAGHTVTLTGNGGFTRTGGGFTYFNRNQTYTGPTTIGAGTILGIGFNTATGNISSSNIINNGKLIFNITSNITFPANISGSGSVEKWRASTVTLTGNNTYTGATQIGNVVSPTAGTLAIANTSALPAATSVIFFSATSGKLQLLSNASCNQLTFAGVLQFAGTYGNTSSSATNKNDTYFDNSDPSYANVLTVASPSPRLAADENASAVQELTVFPNPSAGRYFINVPTENGQQTMNIQVWNIAGQLISNRTVQTVGSEMISIEEQPTGIYMLKVQAGNIQKTFRLVKN
jgi:autotransporter-associated beta strand protein